MSGVLGTFEDRGDLMAALAQLRTRGFGSMEAFSPVLDEELIAAVAPGRSPVYRMTLLGGVAGALSGLALTILTTLQWPLLITGGKPLISMPAFLVIVFTMTILFGSLGTLAGFLYWAVLAQPRQGCPYDRRFSEGHFGLWVECEPQQIAQVIRLMQEKGAVACQPS